MLIDRLAMAVHAADGLEALTDWEMIPDKQREGYVFVARAVLAQLEAEGLKVVPVEATEEMLGCQWEGEEGDFAETLREQAFADWNYALAAAPKPEELP